MAWIKIKIVKTCDVTVDNNMSLAEMINLGNFELCNKHINDKNFPNFPIVGSGKHEVELTLCRLKESSHYDDILNSLQYMGLEPAGIMDLLAIGATHLKIEGRSPVIAFGTAWEVKDENRFPCISHLSHGNERKFDLCSCKKPGRGDCWFRHEDGWIFLARPRRKK